MSEETVSVKVPVFNGEESKYQSWWIKFEAYARVKGFHSVLKNPNLTIIEEDIETLDAKPAYGGRGSDARTEDEEKQLKIGKKNLLAMAHLTMAFGTEALLNKIAASCLNDWPGGLAYMVV